MDASVDDIARQERDSKPVITPIRRTLAPTGTTVAALVRPTTLLATNLAVGYLDSLSPHFDDNSRRTPGAAQ